MIELNTIYNENCLETMKRMDLNDKRNLLPYLTIKQEKQDE